MAVIVKSTVSGGARIGVTLNEDGTQNLFISDNGSVLDLTAGTADATATPEDVLSGKTFYAAGIKNTGTLTASSFNPVLLWTNASPTSDFIEQTITLPTGYKAFIVEQKSHATHSLAVTVTFYVPFGFTGQLISQTTHVFNSREYVSVSESGIEFGSGYHASTADNTYGIPLRIWGVNFTLD